MNNTNHNNTSGAITEENEISVPRHKTADVTKNSSTPKTDRDTKVVPEEKPYFNNDLPIEKEIKEPAVPVPSEIEESEAELPHQPDEVRPEDVVETEQEPPEKIITAKDIEKAKKIEVSPVNLLEQKPMKKLEPLTPVKKKKILPTNMSSSEVVTSLKDLRSRLNELLLKANKARITHSEKNLDRIMEYAWETQKITNDDVEKLTGVKHAQATRLLKKLVKNGKLARFGRYKYTFYKPIKK